MNTQARSRILVVDDHPIVRHGIAELFGAQADMLCTAEADSAAAALHLLRESAFDLLVIDINLPGISGLELVRRIRAMGIETPILMLSMHEETVYAERALAAGARGYLMKQEATDMLVGAARKLLAGGIYVSGAMEQRMLDRLVGTRAVRPSPAGVAALNEREFEVLQMIAQGLTSIEIAQRICRSLKSVEAYRASIRTKLGAKSTIDLARLAIELSGARQT